MPYIHSSLQRCPRSSRSLRPVCVPSTSQRCDKHSRKIHWMAHSHPQNKIVLWNIFSTPNVNGSLMARSSIPSSWQFGRVFFAPSSRVLVWMAWCSIYVAESRHEKPLSNENGEKGPLNFDSCRHANLSLRPGTRTSNPGSLPSSNNTFLWTTILTTGRVRPEKAPIHPHYFSGFCACEHQRTC